MALTTPEVRRFLHLEKKPLALDRQALETELIQDEERIVSLNKALEKFAANNIAGFEERTAQTDRKLAEFERLLDKNDPDLPSKMSQYNTKRPLLKTVARLPRGRRA